MGKQTALYMTKVDLSMLYDYAHGTLGLLIGERDGNEEPVVHLSRESLINKGTLCIWDERLCPRLMRTWIPDPGYYRADTLRLPVMGLDTSFCTTWKKIPALGQGRIFGNFEAHFEKPTEFLKSYNALIRWVKKAYRKGPRVLGGYVGPSAAAFNDSGGYLLPAFVPPDTLEWESTLQLQHPL